ncbi:hypothetical protein TherJR_0097 [Thermincola potens JR]|uniref:Uncharacterized protein n=1 Tax=Thermincola potens (strain JR) TaxID=635013 RepID=D5X8Z3_THEPJ|nr:hypothetical protein TherJR_0097 [Thermincola potens JR]
MEPFNLVIGLIIMIVVIRIAFKILKDYGINFVGVFQVAWKKIKKYIDK